MFTGIVEELGTLTTRTDGPDSSVIEIAATTVTAATSSSGCEGHFECVGIWAVVFVVGEVCWCRLDMRAAFAKVEPRAMKLSKSCSTFSLGKPNYSR